MVSELLVKFEEPIFTFALSSSATYVGFQVNISGQLAIRGNPIPWLGITTVKADVNGKVFHSVDANGFW